MLNKRQKVILHFLENTTDFVTVESIATHCGLSKRTIYSELEGVSDYLERIGKSLLKKRGVGILIKESSKNRSSETSEMILSEPRDILHRRLLIMSYLLFDAQPFTYQSLSDQFLVSKTSIVKDVEFMMSILSEYTSLALIGDRQGTYLKGTEADFQMGMLCFNRLIMEHSEVYSKEMLPQHIEILSSYYGEDIIKTCQNVFYDYIRKNVNAISDHYVQNVLSSLIILVYRCSKGYHHCQQGGRAEKFFDESSQTILEKINLRLGIEFSREDRVFFSQQLVLNRFEKVESQPQFDDFIKKLLKSMTLNLKINFLRDEKLKQQLADHVPAMLYRLQSNVIVENPFTDQIKREFILIFNLISMVIVEIEKDFQVSFNENEVAFLTIYFQSAIERARISKRILVVCQMGVATSELLIYRIKQTLPSLDTIELSSVAELKYIDLSQFDFIISTVHLDISHKDVILVSPFLSDKDIENIKAAGYRPSTISTPKTAKEFHHLYTVMSEKEIFLDRNFKDKETFFQKFGQELVEKKIVTDSFIDDLFHREKLGATDLPMGIAVPHGSPENILQSKIFLIKNQRKIKWNDYFVDIIFVICISPVDKFRTKGILSDIYNIIDNPQLLQLIRREKSASYIIDTLYGGNKNESTAAAN